MGILLLGNQYLEVPAGILGSEVINFPIVNTKIQFFSFIISAKI